MYLFDYSLYLQIVYIISKENLIQVVNNSC